MDVVGALREAGKLGGYFALGSGAGRPVSDLHDPDSDALDRLIDEVTAAIGAPEPRIGASILFQGFAARLWSLTLGPLSIAGVVPDLAPDRLWWRSANGSLTLGLEPVEATADGVFRTVVDQHLLPLVDATQQRVRLPTALLWGNAASALVGTVRVLNTARGWDSARDLLERGPLRGTLAGPDLQRRSCCLFYRVPHGGLCGDCALR
ncbi:(2Fe-2S)-binding protein [Cryptosporangium phraense]|uniref:Ferric iron reductase n=1 Tax=Cryptosporangium phraense TaxID=2593070 RepID=A0A545AY63_9ACTN|nr:(2Fe-2S)-binding protein [Cryptosporangium phraense]TQS46276.1 ferric iron reductase [Cryptosporangium phraense]